MSATVSIIICTRNNIESLGRTLAAFENVDVPNEWRVEIIVVDNASSDNTADALKKFCFDGEVRYVFEPVNGLSNARNSGLRVANGQVILFTDDDVVPCKKWIEIMAGPILRQECDGITGRIELSPDLLRPWMHPMHDAWLACARKVTPELVGACMGFHRSILDKIAGFDPELGAGALGFCEETLFSNQMTVAGFKISVIDDTCVVHHPRKSRLIRRQWLESAKNRGRSSAYVLHHWEHVELKFPLIRARYYQLKLWARRKLQPPPGLEEEGCPAWELSYLFELEKLKWFRHESRRERNYEKHGFNKLPR